MREEAVSDQLSAVSFSETDPEAEEYQYRDPRRVVRSLRERTAPGLAGLREEDAVDALIEAEDLLANALTVVRLCLGMIVVDDDDG